MEVLMYELLMDSERKPCLEKTGSIAYNEREQADCSFSNPEVIADFFNEKVSLYNRPEEHVYMLGLNGRLKAPKLFLLSRGSSRNATLSPQSIFTRLFLAGCESFVLIHNHPSGSDEPSREDIGIVKALSFGANLFGNRFLDSIIVTPDKEWVSLREEGFFDEMNNGRS